MAHKKSPEELSAAELEQLLYARRRAEREQRLRRAQADGRIVIPDPDREPGESTPPDEARIEASLAAPRRSFWGWLADRGLLLVEITAAVALLVIIGSLWSTNRQLNRELAEAQAAQSQALALPTATATPAIGVVLLPGGHRPPIDGQAPEPGEADGIPEHLLPIVNAYVPPPVPTPGPETARRLEIPTLSGDYPIVQGDDWEQLKKGIGQYVGSGRPGQPGNVVLSGHNDIYGEPFRYLDRLKPGDEIIVSTERQTYTYLVEEVRVVGPTDVWVMGPTDFARVTLISCYPYRVNTRRIVVFGRLAEETTALRSDPAAGRHSN